jgi:hypothetical protein
MPYPELLALIDSKIALLTSARHLLSTSALPPILDVLKRDEPLPLAEAELLTAVEPSTPGAAQTGEEAVQKVRQMRPRARRERSFVSRVKTVEPSALRGHLPEGPVFVAATRAAKSAKEDASAAASFEKPADMPTAAQLTQRWLHASS